MNLKRLSPGVVAALALMLLFALWMGWLSIRRHASYNTSMLDLGNVTQAVWSATQGRPLEYTFITGSVSRFYNHMELFYFLLALPYALAPRPETLLAIQAGLYAAGGWPVFRLASRRLGGAPYGLALMLVYLLYPVAQTAVLFDVHGDTLAMPFVLFAIEAMDGGRRRRFAVAALLAASCKLYAALAVLLLAGILWMQRRRREALVTGMGAALWVGFLFLLKALFAAAEPTAQAGTGEGGILGYLSFYLSGAVDPGSIPLRLVNALVVILPVIAVAWRAPLWLLAAGAFILPALMIREQGYNYIFHHYALAVPFLVASAVYGLESHRRRLASSGAPPKRAAFGLNLLLGITLVLTAAANVMLVQTPLSPLFYQIPYISSNEIPARAFSERDRLKDAFLRQIPAGVPVWANSFLAPRLVERREIYVTRYERPLTGPEMQRIHDRAEYYIEDIFSRETNSPTLELAVRGGRFRLLRAQDGFFLFGTYGDGLEYAITPLEGTPAGLRDSGGPSPAPGVFLAAHSVEPLEGSRARLAFEWVEVTPVEGPVLIVTHIDGVPDSRIIHLPSLALLPPDKWQPGTVYRETITIDLPEGVAVENLRLQTGWYDRAHPAAHLSDEESLLGDLIPLE